MLFEENQLYNQKEVAQKLRVTPWTVWRLCRDEILPPRVPGLKFYSGADIQRVISTHTPWKVLKAREELEAGQQRMEENVQVIEVNGGSSCQSGDRVDEDVSETVDA